MTWVVRAIRRDFRPRAPHDRDEGPDDDCHHDDEAEELTGDLDGATDPSVPDLGIQDLLLLAPDVPILSLGHLEQAFGKPRLDLVVGSDNVRRRKRPQERNGAGIAADDDPA